VLIDGVANEEPVPREEPPDSSAYQLSEPILAVAASVTLPVPHPLPVVVLVTAGIGLTVTVSVKGKPVQFALTGVTVYVAVWTLLVGLVKVWPMTDCGVL
jgi:hypothetical protein